jgi:hypothetical protein
MMATRQHIDEDDDLADYEVPHANRHPEEYYWQNIETGELTPATQAVPFYPPTRLVHRDQVIN